MNEQNEALIFDGLYKITNNGRLYSIRNQKWLKPAEDRYGYLCYVVSINGCRYTRKAHRLVAESFIPNPEGKPTVDHINGERTDNRVENLRWATFREQQSNPVTMKKNALIHAKTDYRAMSSKRRSSKKRTQVFKDGLPIGTFDSVTSAANALALNVGKVSECANGKRKTTGGYQICFV